MEGRKIQRLAALGGAYGNLAALGACIADARAQGSDLLAFLGDAIGCCGHSEEVVAMVREHFDVLVACRELGLVTFDEGAELMALFDPAFPFFSAVRLADSIHLHVRVDDVARLPHAELLALGAHTENARDGYIKYVLPGGINLICSAIDVAEEDLLPPPEERRSRPHVDHFGVDLRREAGVVRAAFEDVPALARRAGWAHAGQGGPGRAPVYCCHAVIAQKHWVYPGAEAGQFSRPVEFAYGPLQVTGEMMGCDLRPIDPRHPEAAALSLCATQKGAEPGRMQQPV